MDERHRGVAGFFETWATLGPAWGMIGTLIGLVNMLRIFRILQQSDLRWQPLCLQLFMVHL